MSVGSKDRIEHVAVASAVLTASGIFVAPFLFLIVGLAAL